MNLLLRNSTALVIAATDGIGLQIAHSLAEEGARVVVNGATNKSVDAAIKQIRSCRPQARLERSVADLASEEGCLLAIQEYPDLDVFVANLAIIQRESPFAKADRSLRLPFPPQILGAIRLSRHYVSAMCQRDGGRLVFVVLESNPDGSTETGCSRFARGLYLNVISSLAELIRGSQVTLSSVFFAAQGEVCHAPDSIGFPRSASPHNAAQLSGRRSLDCPFARLIVPPEQVATLVAFLCSPRSSAMGSATIRVGFQSGGMGEPDNEATWNLLKG